MPGAALWTRHPHNQAIAESPKLDLMQDNSSLKSNKLSNKNIYLQRQQMEAQACDLVVASRQITVSKRKKSRDQYGDHLPLRLCDLTRLPVRSWSLGFILEDIPFQCCYKFYWDHIENDLKSKNSEQIILHFLEHPLVDCQWRLIGSASCLLVSLVVRQIKQEENVESEDSLH